MNLMKGMKEMCKSENLLTCSFVYIIFNS